MNQSKINKYSESNNKDEYWFRLVTKYTPVIIIVALVAITIFFWNFGNITGDNIGQIGDYFGGWLNPLLTFINVLLLIFSIRFQVHELKETRLEVAAAREAQEQSSVANIKQAQLIDQQILKAQQSFNVEQCEKAFNNCQSLMGYLGAGRSSTSHFYTNKIAQAETTLFNEIMIVTQTIQNQGWITALTMLEPLKHNIQIFRKSGGSIDFLPLISELVNHSKNQFIKIDKTDPVLNMAKILLDDINTLYSQLTNSQR
jgi:uncharacterized membrane protein